MWLVKGRARPRSLWRHLNRCGLISVYELHPPAAHDHDFHCRRYRENPCYNGRPAVGAPECCCQLQCTQREHCERDQISEGWQLGQLQSLHGGPASRQRLCHSTNAGASHGIKTWSVSELLCRWAVDLIVGPLALIMVLICNCILSSLHCTLQIWGMPMATCWVVAWWRLITTSWALFSAAMTYRWVYGRLSVVDCMLNS